ncbi:TPA: hypothetical protein ACIBXU_004576 [Salmonella enterica subsp. enterica serovar Saintpaul]|uniref:hypothetical protein n=1 Tax=Escherichia coli TaxID=562 RepID=UPI000A189D7F|nr:hypothetical protein [Escherichia coli]OSL21067.1 putative histidyl-tRNA synthetase (Histidine--tRNA ligase)(HisRS) [Escherichia coli TA255]
MNTKKLIRTTIAACVGLAGLIGAGQAAAAWNNIGEQASVTIGVHEPDNIRLFLTDEHVDLASDVPAGKRLFGVGVQVSNAVEAGKVGIRVGGLDVTNYTVAGPSEDLKIGMAASDAWTVGNDKDVAQYTKAVQANGKSEPLYFVTKVKGTVAPGEYTATFHATTMVE